MEIFHPALIDVFVVLIKLATRSTIGVCNQLAFAAGRPGKVRRFVDGAVELRELALKVLIDVLLRVV